MEGASVSAPRVRSNRFLVLASATGGVLPRDADARAGSIIVAFEAPHAVTEVIGEALSGVARHDDTGGSSKRLRDGLTQIVLPKCCQIAGRTKRAVAKNDR